MSNEHNQTAGLWRGAKTLEELGDLTAKWIEGSLSYHPCYGGGIDGETEPLQEVLTFFNRNGLVTTFSQPAEPLDEEGFGQRACVEGYAREEVAKRIAALGLYTDLLVLIYPSHIEWGYQIPISLQEYQPFTWCGPCWGHEQLECFEEDCSTEAMDSLASAWLVVVMDLQWGRENHLWDHVRNALINPPDKPFDVTPSPDLDLDKDFVF
jgi:hypothetical protein